MAVASSLERRMAHQRAMPAYLPDPRVKSSLSNTYPDRGSVLRQTNGTAVEGFGQKRSASA